MKQNLAPEKSRREFLKGGVRTVLMGGFLLVGGFLGKRRFSDSRLEACPIDLPCTICSKWKDCEDKGTARLLRKQTKERSSPPNRDEGENSGE